MTRLLHALLISVALLAAAAPRAHAKPEATRKAKLTWDEIADVAHYELEVSAKPGMEPVLSLRKPKVTSDSLKLKPGTYYYRVRGIDADERPGPWSDVQAFLVLPYPPEPLTPGSDQTFRARPPRDEIVFTWEKGEKGMQYLFELRDADGEIVNRGFDNPKYAWKPERPGDYRWRVGFASPRGEQWGAYRTFKVEASALPPPKALPKPEARKALVDVNDDKPYPSSVWLIGRAAESVVAYTTTDLDTSKTSAGAALVGVYSAELRWRGAKRKGDNWLLSGSLNFELIKQNVLDAQFTLPRGYARFFANHELGERSGWRAGPFVQANYGKSAIFVVQSAQSARQGTATRYGGGLGGVVVYRPPGSSLLLSFLALARKDFGGSDLPAGVLPNSLDSNLGVEAGFGVALEFASRWMVEGRLRYLQENFSWQPASAAAAANGSSFLQDSFVILDVGLGFRF